MTKNLDSLPQDEQLSQSDKYAAKTLGAEVHRVLNEHVLFFTIYEVYVRIYSTSYDTNRSYFILQVRNLSYSLNQQRQKNRKMDEKTNRKMIFET